uniref:AI-2E family transporter n=1 Tax=Aplanochytrium stocchinoi TaxID=215587 RepID=A0A7S3PMN6_9STRA
MFEGDSEGSSHSNFEAEHQNFEVDVSLESLPESTHTHGSTLTRRNINRRTGCADYQDPGTDQSWWRSTRARTTSSPRSQGQEPYSSSPVGRKKAYSKDSSLAKKRANSFGFSIGNAPASYSQFDISSLKYKFDFSKMPTPKNKNLDEQTEHLNPDLVPIPSIMEDDPMSKSHAFSEEATGSDVEHLGSKADNIRIKTDPSPQLEGVFDLNALEEVLRERGIIRHLRNTLNLVLVPLLLISGIGVGFILVWAEDILVPFVVSVFFTYLLRPMVDFLSRPLGKCHHMDCLPSNLPVAPCLGNSNNATVLLKRRKSTHDSILTDDLEAAEAESGVEMTGLLDRDTIYSNDNNGKAKGLATSKRSSSNKYMSRRDRMCYECQRAKCPRWIAVSLSLMFTFSIFAGLIFFVIDALQAFEQHNLDNYEERAVEIAQKVLVVLKNKLDIDGSYMLKQIRTEFQVVTVTKYLIILLFDAIGYTFIVFLFVLYMLFEEPGMRSKQISRSHSRARSLRRQIDSQIQRYLVIKTVISALVGILVYIILGPCLNVKMAHLFGVITFLANYIPNIGAIVATLLPFPILILDDQISNSTVILAIALPIGVHTIVGNFIEPKVFGDTMELHAVVVLLSLSFWYTVWGIPGAILAVPIMAVIRIVVSNIKHPYALVILRLLEGKLPGTAEFHS